MTSIYLKCDSCGRTLGVEEVVKNRFPNWTDLEILQTKARAIGWTGTLSRDSNSDKCPECSLNEKDEGGQP